MKHIDIIWLVIVAQRKPIATKDLFWILVKADKYRNTNESKRRIENACFHLYRKGHISRKKIDGLFRYEYDDGCLHCTVTGAQFSRALDAGIWECEKSHG